MVNKMKYIDELTKLFLDPAVGIHSEEKLCEKDIDKGLASAISDMEVYFRCARVASLGPVLRGEVIEDFNEVYRKSADRLKEKVRDIVDNEVWSDFNKELTDRELDIIVAYNLSYLGELMVRGLKGISKSPKGENYIRIVYDGRLPSIMAGILITLYSGNITDNEFLELMSEVTLAFATGREWKPNNGQFDKNLLSTSIRVISDLVEQDRTLQLNANLVTRALEYSSLAIALTREKDENESFTCRSLKMLMDTLPIESETISTFDGVTMLPARTAAALLVSMSYASMKLLSFPFARMVQDRINELINEIGNLADR